MDLTNEATTKESAAKLEQLRDAEEGARKAVWAAAVAFAIEPDQSLTGPVLVTALIAYREAVEQRVKAEVAIEQVQEASEQLGAVIDDIKAMVESGPPPEGAA